MVDACQRASANTVNVVMPYFGYARQDRTAAPREPITAKLVANMLVKAGVDRVVTLDLHAAVSYTHLDVYKRQTYGIPTVPGFLHVEAGEVTVRCDSSMSEEEIKAFAHL